MSGEAYGDWANAYGWFAWLFWGAWEHWHVAFRCRTCGVGYEIAKAGEPGRPLDASGDVRWLCDTCGADSAQVVRWIGRKRQRHDYVKAQGYIWQWLPAEKLPADLQPKPVRSKIEAEVEAEVEAEIARRLPKLLDEEFERRVRAAVEVERIARAAGGADP